MTPAPASFACSVLCGILCALCLAASPALSSEPAGRASDAPGIRVIAPIISPPWSGATLVEETASLLRWKLPGRRVTLAWEEPARMPGLLSAPSADAVIALLPPEALILSPERDVRILSSMASRASPDPDNASACVILVREDSPARAIADLRGARAVSGDPKSLAGHLACLTEVARAGFDPDRFFASMRLEGPLGERDAVELLREGGADAALVRAGLAEDVRAASGEDLLAGLRVIEERPAGAEGFRARRSTDAYPGLSVAAAASADPRLIHEAMSVILAKPANAWGQFWTVPADASKADALAKTLRIGRWSFLREWSLARVWEEWRTAIVAGVVLVLALLLHGIRTEALVRRRTGELRAETEERLAAERDAREKAERIESLERQASIGQISAVFAHEMNVPLGALLSSARGVREYAKNRPARRVPADLDAIARKTLPEFATRRRASAVLRITPEPPRTLPVLCDPLEAELALINLLRNALEATARRPDPKVAVRTGVAPADDPADPEALEAFFEVADNGGEVTEALLAAMRGGLARTTKPDGLGLGLGIVTTLARRNGGRVLFSRTPEGGLAAELRLPLATEPAAEAPPPDFL